MAIAAQREPLEASLQRKAGVRKGTQNENKHGAIGQKSCQK